MDWLEEELKNSLNRKEPSPEFEERVLQAAGGVGLPACRKSPKVVAMPRRFLAAAAAVIVLAGASEGYRYHRGQVAKEQVMTAMRIAGSKLNRVQVHLKGTEQ